MNAFRIATWSCKLALLSLLLLPVCASATEGGLGRPMTGLQVMSYAGLVPPMPGFSTMFGYVHYDGSIEASREVPVAGVASLGLDAAVNMFTAAKPGTSRWP